MVTYCGCRAVDIKPQWGYNPVGAFGLAPLAFQFMNKRQRKKYWKKKIDQGWQGFAARGLEDARKRYAIIVNANAGVTYGTH